MYLARKNNSVGSIFKRNLLVAFTIFAVVPAFSVFFLAGKLITKSIDYWFCSNVRSGLSAGVALHDELNQDLWEQLVHEGQQFKATNVLKKDCFNRYCFKIENNNIDWNLLAPELVSWHELRPTIKQHLFLSKKKFVAKVQGIKQFPAKFIFCGNLYWIDRQKDLEDYFICICLHQAIAIRKSLFAVECAAKDFDQLRAMRRPIYVSYLLTLILGTLIALLLAIWCAFYLARGISRPIKELLEAMEKMGKGEWNVITTTNQVNDLHKVILGFNAMSLQLKSAQIRLADMKKDELVQAVKINKIQTWQEAARQVAHEINNPLTPIQLATQRLQRRYGAIITDPAFMDCTQTILEQVALIKNLVSHFKEYGAMPELMPKLLDINSTIQEVVSLYSMSYPDIQFVVNLEDYLPSIKADAQKIKRVLTNLFENSIRAMNGMQNSEKQKQILLKTSFRKGQQQIELLVTDSGPGIDGDILKILFMPYVSTSSTHMGLGLAIVHEIIAQHRGSIKLLPFLGGGAQFQILFPI